MVYGNSLDTYAVLQTMLDCGVSPNNLVLTSPGICTASPHPEATERVQRAVVHAGVSVISEVNLTRCEIKGGRLVELQFHNEGSEGTVMLPCQALVYMATKAVDFHTFKGMHVCVCVCVCVGACVVNSDKSMSTHTHNTPLSSE